MHTESERSQERLAITERRAKIAAFISDTLRPAQKVLDETADQADQIHRFESREYQLEAWDALARAREDGADRGLIHLATGLGKTSVAVFDYARFRRDAFEAGTTPRALFVVHQKNILNQASERFGKILPGSSRGTFTTKQKYLPTNEITFATFQALTSKVNEFPEDYFDYIIYDEAHHIEAETYKKVVEHFKPTFQLGLTATPERSDDKDITIHFGEPVYSKTLTEAMQQGLLANVDYHLVFDDAVKQAMDTDFQSKSLKELKALFDVPVRNEVIAQNVIEQKANIGLDHAKTIVFCNGIEHADEMAELLGGVSYHSSLEKDERERRLHGFRSGDIELITTADMFNEGVDIPDARLIVFLRSTQSQTIFEQQLGRGLRKTPDKDTVSVLDFVANVDRIRLIRSLAKRSATAEKIATDAPADDYFDESNSEKAFAEHGQFIFDEQIIDILSRYQGLLDSLKDRSDLYKLDDDELLALSNQLLPEKYMTVTIMESLSTQALFLNSKIIREKFGSIVAFNRLRGIEMPFHHFSDEEILELANSIAPNTYLTLDALNELSQAGEFTSGSSIHSRFSSIVAFNRLRGIEMPMIYWTNEELIARANVLFGETYANSTVLSEAVSQKLFIGSSPIEKRFGSLLEFNRLRGIPVELEEKMTRDKLIEIGNRVFGDEPLTGKRLALAVEEGTFVPAHTLAKFFTSYAEFDRARGLDVEDFKKFFGQTDEELLELANELFGNRVVDTKTINQMAREKKFISLASINKRWGGIEGFNAVRGVKEKLVRQMDNDELLRLSLELFPGVTVTKAMLDDASKSGVFLSSPSVTKRFGNMANFNELRGTPAGVRTYTEQDIPELLRTAQILWPDKPITQKDLRAVDKAQFPKEVVVNRLFGSLAQLNEARGFESKTYTVEDKQRIIDLAQELSPNKSLTTSDIQDLNDQGLFPSLWTIHSIFGGLRQLNEERGLKRFSEFSNDELLALANEFSPDQKLTSSRIAELSKQGMFASPTIIIRRFGSVNNFNRIRGFTVKEWRSKKQSGNKEE